MFSTGVQFLKIIILPGIISLLFFVTSCQSRQDKDILAPGNELVLESELVEVKYAKGFTVRQYPDYKILKVHNPWQGAQGISFSYLLASDFKAIPDSLLKQHILVSTPVDRIICTSTTHIAFLESLQKTGSVVGVSGTGLITNEQVRDKLKEGLILDIGYERSMNLENLVLLKPDLIMMYGIESEVTAYIQKISDLGIPVVMNGDYLEQTPLGKFEWIKFIAAFYNLENEASIIFDSIANQYNFLKQKTEFVNKRPTVMTGMPWKDVWYISAGNTVLSNFIKDAGGQYLWEDMVSSVAIPMDIENVFNKAGKADYWINSGIAESLSDIQEIDDRFRYFLPLIQKTVYNNNARLNMEGGNDYWESGVTQPQLVLKDLINIFHSGLLPDSSLVFYKKLI
ncbi:MAG: ABC transporter substrate-binding protein [Bacteroidota bacterium]|nr:ABC transporter substrate-binding protein [Bacteroidota bacterium]